MSSYALNRDLRSYEAAADVAGYLIVAGSGTGAKVRAGASATDKIIGVAERVGGDAGQMLDVTIAGVTEVRAGGTFDAFDPLTSDAQGRAIKALPTGNTVVRVVGIAQGPAVVGDIVGIQVAPSTLAKPAA